MRIPRFLPYASLLVASCGEDGTKPPEDLVAPAAVVDLAVTSLRGASARFSWTAPGDDGSEGRATRYSLRYAATELAVLAWDEATEVPPLPEPKTAGGAEIVTVGDLPDGLFWFALRAADEADNWSPLSNVVTVMLAAPDTTAPASVDDLSAGDAEPTRFTLSWTASGDDGLSGRAFSYDLRRSLTMITEVTWEEATLVPGAPAPGEPGSSESFVVSELTPGTPYFVGLKVLDERGNASGLSNVVSISTTADDVPPGRVTDLAIVFSTTRRLSLTWTAPGNDGAIGQAFAYDLRMASEPITEQSWSTSTQVPGLGAPSSAGTLEHVLVKDLEPETTVSFALRSRDEGGNESPLSNVSTGSTGASPLRLTFSVGRGGQGPQWSPLDDRLVYFTGNIGAEQVYDLSFVTGQPRELTERKECRVPSISMDGRQIAFASAYEGGNGLWIMDLIPYAPPTLVASEAEDNTVSSSSWSPDGSEIVYAVNVFPGAKLRVAAVGGGPSRLLVGGDSRNQAPSWSPDGLQVAFGSFRAGNYDVWVVSAEGGEPVQLTFDPSADTSPAWSPDGERLAFASDRSGNYEIWVMSSTGEDPVLLDTGSDPGRDGQPSWSPDGREIAFVSDRTGRSEVWVAAVP